VNQDPYRSYHAVNLEARTARASPAELMLILTDGLLEELARARAHLVGRRYDLKARSVDRSVEMLNGLASALDLEAGGQLAADLAALYEYCARRLYEASLKLDPAPIDEVSGLVATLRAGWHGMQANHG